MNTKEDIFKILEDIANTGTIDSSKLEHLSLDEQELIKNLHAQGLVNEALNFVNSNNVDDNWNVFKNKL